MYTTEAVRLAHLSDIHFGPNHLQEVERCANAALADLRARHEERHYRAIVLSGDLFDHRLESHTPAYRAALRWVRALADVAPVLVLQGTESHDFPGAIDPLTLLGGHYPVAVAATPGTWRLVCNEWCFTAVEEAFQMASLEPFLIAVMPVVNRGALKAPYADYKVSQLVALRSRMMEARSHGIPTVFVSHGTVNGCTTEHGQTLVSEDHEYFVSDLFSVQASAVMLGHIHAHQVWQQDGRQAAFAGSLARLHAGDENTKGWLDWTVKSESATFELVPTPARAMVDIEWSGEPDYDKLREVAAAMPEHAVVRLRYSVAATSKHVVDRKILRDIFTGVERLIIEGEPIVEPMARAPEIAHASTLPEKLSVWTKTTQNPRGAELASMLHRLGVDSTDELIARELTAPATEATNTQVAELDTV